VINVNFVPKERSKKTIDKHLKKRNERSKEKEAEKRRNFLREKYGE
jgi:hypothetical protein